MKIGAHVTTAGGLPNAIVKAKEIGAECIQIFPAPPQGWKMPDRSQDEIDKFNKDKLDAGISPVLIHAIYLLNLASQNQGGYHGSIESLTKSMTLAEKIGAVGVNFHTGSGKDKAFEEVLPQISDALRKVLDKSPAGPKLIIENCAGAGNTIGKDFGQIAKILEACDNNDRLAVCLDTQHIFASGYDIRTQQGLDKLIDEFDKIIGLERLVAIHMNDSKTELASNRDRHENIGAGLIGEEGLGNFLKHPKLAEVPIYIETPGFDGKGPDRQNLDILKKIRG
jgi:deoxyribonuclease-4